MTGKHEIYIDKDGLQYVDACLRFTEFHKMLYDKSHIMLKLSKALDNLDVDKALVLQKFLGGKNVNVPM